MVQLHLKKGGGKEGSSSTTNYDPNHLDVCQELGRFYKTSGHIISM